MSLRVREVEPGRFRVERRRWYSVFWRPLLLFSDRAGWTLAEYPVRSFAEDTMKRAERILRRRRG